ncbi:MAG: hypothetical protein Q9174_002213 [Haloplaca sp. 1 TL-2023]
MATVAAAAHPPPKVGQNISLTTNNPASSAKRKRVDARIGQEGQRSLRDDHPVPEPKLDQSRAKQQQSGNFEPSKNRGRQPSLRHVKDSTEVLRQRSTKKANPDNASESTPEGRAGRQFTVANVGNNGKIYLRPSAKTANQTPQAQQNAVALAELNMKPKSTGQVQVKSSVWSDTQTSIPTRRARSTGRATHESISTTRESLRRSRTLSMSTVDGQMGNAKSKATGFKIVIDPAQPMPDQVERPSVHTLQVPIPHYRLGTPRFSNRGTAILRSSVCTRNSTNEDLTSSAISGPEYDRLFPVPPGTDAHSPVSQRYSQNSTQLQSIQIQPVGDNTQTLKVTSSPAFHRAREPIIPSIYDALATNPDDPAIVRYVSGTRDITAASPARIIAQITSASFLDYELLSDFFLTVRAYLSTHDLLDYLLARFEWAVNKLDDDGRVIRVRAFAALRHWILNYFPYDFVVDRELRVKFCQRLNALMKEVRRRSSQGPSDLKLILDLKKCWNGRCALYWDGPLLDSEELDNADIKPGGIAGSRDSHLTHPSQLWSKVSGVSPPRIEEGSDMDKSTAALNNWFEGIQKAEADARIHQRHTSGATVRSLPTSPTSEQSIQALSCTFPGLGTKKSGAYSHRGAVAHPVTTATPSSTSQRRVCPAAPSALANDEVLQSKPGHKRSGSFSDAVRDKRTSLPSMHVEKPAPQVEMAFPYQGSLIRGTIIPPVSPYIDQFAPTSPVSEIRQRFFQDSDGSDEDACSDEDSYDGDDGEDDEVYSSSSSNKVAYTSHPGMKNIFGSIRRALSSKQVGQPPLSMASADFSVPSVARSKSSQVTSNNPYTKKTNTSQRQLDTSRQNARIDLLCADVMDMFQRALMQASEEDASAAAIYRSNLANFSPGHSLVHPDVQVRNHSGVTNGSRSIPIFDDTGLDEPVPIIPSEFLKSHGDHHGGFGGSNVYQQVPRTSTEPATPTGYSQPSPLARLSNAAAVADRVFSAPLQDDVRETSTLQAQQIVQSPPPPLDDAQISSAVHSSPTKPHGQSRPPPPSRMASSKSMQAAPKSLRKYASYQSSIQTGDSGKSRNTMTAAGPMSQSPGITQDRAPGRMLRRRPGGDLRATENIHELDKVPRRSRSAGSVTTYTESLRGSGHTMHRIPRAASTHKAPLSQVTPLTEAVAEPVKKPISLIRTHSSQPALRASFEAALAEFAQIPDEEGGDIEATLLKLEGKYRKSQPMRPRGVGVDGKLKASSQTAQDQRAERSDAAYHNQGEGKMMSGVNEGVSFPIPPDPQLALEPKQPHFSMAAEGTNRRSNMTRSLYATSDESYDSTPVLERGPDDQAERQETPKAAYSDVSIPPPLFSPSQSAADTGTDRVPLSPQDDAEVPYFRRGARCRSSIPTTTDSFLLDEDEFLSDLSSEISDDTIEADDDIDYPFGSAAQLVRNENRPPKIGYLLGYPTHPPTPPMTQDTAKAISSQTERSHDSRKPPTPDPSPVSLPVQPAGGKASGAQIFSISTQNLSAHRHVPFIMSFDSVVLAQQFTIIERDALNEINWQDLIDMRWHHNSPSTLNWVDYLRTQEPTGIELVTARFNLMVKWVLSEIVLTQMVEERAMAIIKYIHIARYCRTHHNYATLFQLTIALTSVDISRLTKTWDLVPAGEKKTLKELESLVTPIKNFHNLRQEMETTNSEEGCIPVIALYIHDLTYNSQKPSQVPSTRAGEPLVNFERYRTTASIVKSLLRLIDASSKYNYQPEETALSQCLWMASLSDEMIRSKSKELE